MKIIYNNIIPFKRFVAVNIFGNLFIRNSYKSLIEKYSYYRDKLINHESIHTEQMKDFACFLPKCMQQYIGGIFFYLIYAIEWLFRVLFVKPFSHEAYRSVLFEVEARTYENDLTYIDTRKHFAFWRK